MQTVQKLQSTNVQKHKIQKSINIQREGNCCRCKGATICSSSFYHIGNFSEVLWQVWEERGWEYQPRGVHESSCWGKKPRWHPHSEWSELPRHGHLKVPANTSTSPILQANATKAWTCEKILFLF